MTARLLLLLAASLLPAALAAQTAPVWQMQNSGSTASLRGIVAVDDSIAWASGTEGTVLRTLDGGQHWTRCATPDAAKDGASLDFRGVQAWDEKTAIAMASGPGDKSRLYKTTDGCASWTLVFANPDKDGFWDAVSIADRKNISIFGDPVDGKFVIFDTADGGIHWKKEQDAGLQSNESEGAFAASNSSLLALWGDGVSAFGAGSPSGTRIFLECDPCNTKAMWHSLTLSEFPKGKAAGIFSIHARDGRRWIAVGGDYIKPNEAAGTAAYTSDGGLHWTASAKNPHGYRSSVQWWEQEKLWITVGTNGSDLSRDDGRNWQRLDDGNWNALGLPFVVGPHGRIARLVEAGK
jgi:photosystem II stability/assembly factor-like uncharacterized protein